MQAAAPNEAIWILFDHESRVLRTGEEPIEPPCVRKALEERYPGIQISDVTVKPVLERGRTLHLHCVWLERGSPLPGS
jgi:hypothetical protein